MFVQIIEGSVSDREALLRQWDRWATELKPGATGFLGSTGGVTADGRSILVGRFESEAAARANSERTEQGNWWAEAEKCFSGSVSFSESTDIETFMGGGTDDAGFVQVMKLSGVDRDRLHQLDAVLEREAPKFRPDLRGGLRIWTGPDTCVEVNYFSSEAEARAGEQTEPPPEVASALSEFQSIAAGAEFLDISDPLLDSA